MREGLRYIWQTPELRSILLLMLVVGTFAINSPVVLPLLAKITFDGNAEVYSWMTIAMGAGALFGALVRGQPVDTPRRRVLCRHRPGVRRRHLRRVASRRRWGCSSHGRWSSGRGRSRSSRRANSLAAARCRTRRCAAG